jgi:hypothetical protein
MDQPVPECWNIAVMAETQGIAVEGQHCRTIAGNDAEIYCGFGQNDASAQSCFSLSVGSELSVSG